MVGGSISTAVKVPVTVTFPFTSSGEAGVVVSMPTLPLARRKIAAPARTVSIDVHAKPEGRGVPACPLGGSNSSYAEGEIIGHRHPETCESNLTSRRLSKCTGRGQQRGAVRSVANLGRIWQHDAKTR